MTSIERLSSKLANKIAQSSDEDKEAFIKKTKNQLAPWFNGLSKILLNLQTSAEEIGNDPDHKWNKMDQSSGNVLTSFNTIKKQIGYIAKNLQNPKLSIKKIQEIILYVESIERANPSYKAHPLYLIKPNSQYSLDQCLIAVKNIINTFNVQVGAGTAS